MIRFSKPRYPLAGSVLIVAAMVIGGPFGCRIMQRRPVIFEKLVDVGGHRLHIKCEGSGSPTVIADAGTAGTIANWDPVRSDIGRFTRICSYDRAGLGMSDQGPLPRTSELMVQDLHRLLTNAGITGPYVLVGHSFGGGNVRLYAAHFPNEVAGMVLIDSVSEFGDERLGTLLTERSLKARDEMENQYNPEKLDREASLAQVRAANWHADIPLIVLVRSGKPYRPNEIGPDMTPEKAVQWEQIWRDLQKELASRSPRGKLVIAEKSGHFIQRDQPDVVINAVHEVVDAVRSGPQPAQTTKRD